MKRWRGLKSLVVDAVEHGSRAVEKIQIIVYGLFWMSFFL